MTATIFSTVAPSVADHLGRLEHLPAGGGDVLDQQHVIAGLDLAFVHLLRAVVLLGVADDHEGHAAGHRRRGRQGHAAQLGPGDARRVPAWRRFGEAPAQLAQDVRLGLEEVLVEVVLALAAGAEGEVAAQQGRRLDRFEQFHVVHARCLQSRVTAAILSCRRGDRPADTACRASSRRPVAA